MKAIWRNQVIAESDATVVVDGNHYFPANSVRQDLLRPSEPQTVCGWKGTASYYDVIVEGQANHDAAWYYPTPLPAASDIAGCVAFWHGVEIIE